MEIIQKTSNTVEVFKVNGRLDSNTSDLLKEKLDQILENGTTQVVIDFEHLDYISSAGIRVILRTVKVLKRTQGNLVLCSLQDYVREVFEIAGFDGYLTIEQNLDRALQVV
ncbi:MAG: STAS domain-containing protein [Desulfobacterium sp.]|nr:STAS domain-containing protein [Desulfobacterium sp.]